MSLMEEINKNRQTIHTDAYPMSVGELASLYEDGDVDIHPEFQRMYRWTHEQKVKLIESIFLGIPLPSIFVAQRDDGVWDVIDGLQRLSTIFSFMGILKDEYNKLENPLNNLILSETFYLPSFQDKTWENKNPDNEIHQDLKRAFKREKIDIKIIKKESNDRTKYELFQRLNTGGTTLSPQEVRNCLLIMLNHDAYDWLKELSEFDDFKKCIPLSERIISEEGYMEYALRFFIYRYYEVFNLPKHEDLHLFLTDSMNELFKKTDFNFESEKEIFKKVFSFYANTFGEDSFKKYDVDQKRYKGVFMTSMFEVLAIGISFHTDLIDSDIDTLQSNLKAIKEDIHNHDTFQKYTKHGTTSLNRYYNLVELGKGLF